MGSDEPDGPALSESAARWLRPRLTVADSPRDAGSNCNTCDTASLRSHPGRLMYLPRCDRLGGCVEPVLCLFDAQVAEYLKEEAVTEEGRRRLPLER